MKNAAVQSNDATTRNDHTMVRRSLLGALVATIVLLLGASPSYAATDSWTMSRTHGTIYFDGGWSTGYYQVPQTTLPANPVITGTEVTVTPYSNGFAADTVTICYGQQYSTSDFVCLPDFTVTATTTVTTDLFNGQNAKGWITVRHTLTGGTYPAFGAPAQDTVTVNYSY